jgi:hypothetical protein
MVDQEVKRKMMNHEMIAVDVIEVVETGVFKTEHVFQSTTHVFGVLTLKAGKSEGVYSGADGTTLEYKKTSFWKSNYELRQGSAAVASAAPRSKLSRAMVLSFEADVYGLFPGGKGLRSWILKNIQNQVICEIRPRKAFKRGGYLKILSPISFNLLVFVYCLVQKRWQEQSS